MEVSAIGTPLSNALCLSLQGIARTRRDIELFTELRDATRETWLAYEREKVKADMEAEAARVRLEADYARMLDAIGNDWWNKVRTAEAKLQKAIAPAWKEFRSQYDR